MPRRIRWTLAPDADLNGETLDPQKWLDSGHAEVVKNGPHRAVYRVRLPQLRLYWKQCKLATIRAFLRELVRPPKARMEFDKAMALRARQIPTIQPLAWGVRRGLIPGESFLLTRSLEGTLSLSEFLAEPRTPRVRQRIAIELGGFLARLHNAGVTHPDLHPGNLLVAAEPSGAITFYLLDLHAIHLGEPLDAARSQDNLIMLNRWFQMRATRADRLRFWRAYLAQRPSLAVDPRALESLTAESNHRFWRSREWRYTGSNRYFQRVCSAVASGYAVRDVDAATLRTLAADPDAPFRDPNACVLKASRSSTVIVWAMPTATGPRPVLYKRFQVRKRLDPWLNLLRPSGAWRSWCRGQSLRDRGLPTPRPLLMLHRKRYGLPREGYLLTEFIPDASDLRSHMATLPGSGRWQLIDQLGRLIRTLHERRLAHRDLKAANIVIDAAGEPQLIDLVGVSDHSQISSERRIQNLARLNASFLHHEGVTRSDRLRFLRIYLNWSLHGKAGWKDWWREIGRATQLKAAKNERSGRPLA